MQTYGRVMPLFGLTEGMHPDATGRELITIRSFLLGLTGDETAQITPEVIEFCELGDYIDMPVRTYSTGMLVRLAFAITTAVTAEILLFDELIGAGDASFVEKAQARLEKFVERSSVIVLATHSQDIMRNAASQCRTWRNRLRREVDDAFKLIQKCGGANDVPMGSLNTLNLWALCRLHQQQLLIK